MLTSLQPRHCAVVGLVGKMDVETWCIRFRVSQPQRKSKNKFFFFNWKWRTRRRKDPASLELVDREQSRNGRGEKKYPGMVLLIPLLVTPGLIRQGSKGEECDWWGQLIFSGARSGVDVVLELQHCSPCGGNPFANPIRLGRRSRIPETMRHLQGLIISSRKFGRFSNEREKFPLWTEE